MLKIIKGIGTLVVILMLISAFRADPSYGFGVLLLFIIPFYLFFTIIKKLLKRKKDLF